MMILSQALLPSQALLVLGTTIAHRREMVMSEESLLRYFETGCKNLNAGWSNFQILKPFAYDGWATLILDGAEAEEGPTGLLQTRVKGLQLQIRTMMPPGNTGRTPFLPESRRPLYEKLAEEEEVHHEHRIYQVQNGYVRLNLNENAPTATVHHQIAEFLGVPANMLAVARITYSAPEMKNWVVAGRSRH